MKSENKDENQKKTGYLPTKASLMLRLLVSAYLIHIIYSLRDVAEKYSGIELALFIAAMVIFGAIAIFFIIHSARAFLTGNYAGGANDIRQTENPEEKGNIEDEEDRKVAEDIEPAGDTEEAGNIKETADTEETEE